MLFMIAASGSAVVTLFRRSLAHWRGTGSASDGTMAVTSGILIVMATALIALGAGSFMKSVKKNG